MKSYSELIALGKQAFDKGDYTNAVKWYAKAVKKSSAKRDFYLHVNYRFLADAQYELKQYPEAIASINCAIRLAPRNSEAQAIYYNQRGLMYERLGDLNAASSDFFFASKSYRETVVFTNLARVELAQNSYMAAEDAARSAIAIDPHCALAYRYLGDALCEKKYYSDALDSLGKAIALMPGEGVFYNQRGLVYECLGNLDAALNDFSTASKNSRDAVMAFSNAARVLIEKKDYQSAMTWAQAAIDQYPTSHVGYGALARALLCLGRYEEVIINAKRAIELKSKDGAVYEYLGDALRFLGRYHEAIQSYTEGLTVTSEKKLRAELYNNRGLCTYELKNYDAAIKDYDVAIQLGKESGKPNACSYHNKGISLSKKNKIDEAQTNYLLALEIDPDYMLAQQGLAFCCFENTQFVQAIALTKKIIVSHSSYHSAWHMQGLCYIELQEYRFAYESLDQAARVSFNDTDSLAIVGFSRLLIHEVSQAKFIFEKILKELPEEVNDVPEHYVDNLLANKRINKKNTSTITQLGKIICLLGLDCIAIAQGTKPPEVLLATLKQCPVIKGEIICLILGFTQAYSNKLQSQNKTVFRQLCNVGLTIFALSAKDNTTPRLESYRDKLNCFIAFMDKLEQDARTHSDVSFPLSGERATPDASGVNSTAPLRASVLRRECATADVQGVSAQLEAFGLHSKPPRHAVSALPAKPLPPKPTTAKKAAASNAYEASNNHPLISQPRIVNKF